jgi:hypothetical protein
MGSGSSPDQEAVTVRMARPAESSQSEAVSRISGDDLLLIYHAGRLHNRDLVPIEPDTLDPTRRTVLALPPDTSFAEAMRVRSRLHASDLIVTALDERWLDTLKEIQP